MSKFSEKRIIDDIRLLSLDMLKNNNLDAIRLSLEISPVLYSLFANHIEFDLEKKNYPNRDRFVMTNSSGNASLYATLFATCEDYTLDELKNYGKMNSCTKSYSEINISKRIETSSMPRGLGLSTSVGLAMAEKHLEGVYNTKKMSLFDYKIYCLCTDEDIMEGVSYESASLAGENKLNNLIVLYVSECNNGESEEKIVDMYVSLGWDVLTVKNGDRVSEIDRALEIAKRSDLPSLIIINNDIDKYLEKVEKDKEKIKKELSLSDIPKIRKVLDEIGPFNYDEECFNILRKNVKTRTQRAYADWYELYKKYLAGLNEDDKNKLDEYLNDEKIELNIDKIIDKDKIFLDKPMIDINYQIMNVISNFINRFIGGTSNLKLETKAYLKKCGDYSLDNYKGKNINFGFRENAMGAILNGFALTNFKCFASTLLVYSDYLKPSIRSSAIMNLPVTYIFTDNGILSEKEKGVEQLGMLRSVPNLDVYTPCDYKELIGSWNLILKNNRPSALIVSNEPTETYKFTSVEEVSYGAYVISEVKNRLDVILIASGKEVTLAMNIKKELLKNFIEARIVSMPNIEEFFKQSKEYQNQVLPKGYKRMVIEFSNDSHLYKLVKNEEDIININTFIKSGTKEEILNEYEIDIPSIIIKIKNNI